jgi:hypothetical protein
MRIMAFATPAKALQPAPPADEVDQDHDDGKDQKNVDETSQRVGGHESENPQYEQNNRDRIKHGTPPDFFKFPGYWPTQFAARAVSSVIR